MAFRRGLAGPCLAPAWLLPALHGVHKQQPRSTL